MADFTQSGLVCHVSGRLTQVEVAQLWPERRSLLAANTRILELSALNYSDSAGIAFILELVSLAKIQCREFEIVGAQAQLSKLIGLYGLELFFNDELKDELK